MEHHWKQFQSTMYATLEAEQRTLDEMDQLINEGMAEYEAREIVYPKYLLLPDENEDQEQTSETWKILDQMARETARLKDLT